MDASRSPGCHRLSRLLPGDDPASQVRGVRMAHAQQHLASLVDYQFTAKMEDDLDAISRGDLKVDGETRLPALRTARRIARSRNDKTAAVLQHRARARRRAKARPALTSSPFASSHIQPRNFWLERRYRCSRRKL